MKKLSKAQKFKHLKYFSMFGTSVGMLIGVVFLFIDPLSIIVRILLMAVFDFCVATAVIVIVSKCAPRCPYCGQKLSVWTRWMTYSRCPYCDKEFDEPM